jgi:prepilin-type N-terminal cleavage/methylation domain-containing protein
MTRKHNEQGFTLPELLVVAGIIVLMMLGSMVILRPASYAAQTEDAQRQTDIAHLAQALQRYKAKKGHFPVDIQPTATGIGSEETQYNLCATLVPEFIKDIPIDPAVGLKYKNNGTFDQTKELCTAKDVIFTSGYAVEHGNDGALKLRAPAAESGKIEITIR